MSLVDYLLHQNIINNLQIKEAKQNQLPNTSLINHLVESNIFSSDWLLKYCAKQFNLPIFNLENFEMECLATGIVKLEFLLRYKILPLQRQEQALLIGLVDPTDHSIIQATQFHTGLSIKPVLVDCKQLELIIKQLARDQLNNQLISTLPKYAEEEKNTIFTLGLDDEPIIHYVNNLIAEAISQNASDIHIEPFEQYCRIRLRRDGLLRELTTIPHALATRVTARLKILANLNIAEKRLPQDGRLHISNNEYERKTDIRINTCPTLFGEKIALRIVNLHQQLKLLDLGFTDEQLQLFQEKLAMPQGLILVTGPTGSGKTLTLYSALQYLNDSAKNISTVEDPIEIELPGINQVAINPKIGLDFAAILRAFLRQDPDVIMVGEIRDKETATIALQAAQTGHLVLSTLHTNTAIEAIIRLQSLNIDKYALAHSLSLILSTRLIRKLCSRCRTDNSNNIISCQSCHGGYAGRTGIFEILNITESISSLISNQASASQILIEARKQNFKTLKEVSLQKINSGLTSLQEIERVLGKRYS